MCSELNLLELVKRKIIIEKGNKEGNMGELVTTVTKFKSKPGSENKLIEELRSFDAGTCFAPNNCGNYLSKSGTWSPSPIGLSQRFST